MLTDKENPKKNKINLKKRSWHQNHHMTLQAKAKPS